MDSHHHGTRTRVKLFGAGRPIRDALGGGKGKLYTHIHTYIYIWTLFSLYQKWYILNAVADLLLWKDKKVSGAVLGGVTVVWFLFEIVEYNFITLLCHITITTMLLLFIWSAIANLFKW